MRGKRKKTKQNPEGKITATKSRARMAPPAGTATPTAEQYVLQHQDFKHCAPDPSQHRCPLWTFQGLAVFLVVSSRAGFSCSNATLKGQISPAAPWAAPLCLAAPQADQLMTPVC